jgi:hypothetical protein
MWFEKLFSGVLCVLTPLGPRYIKPSFAQRIYLIWVFRHFQILPLQVLTRGQLKVIDALCVEPRFVSLTNASGGEFPIVGTLERRPPVSAKNSESRRQGTAISDAMSPFASDLSKAQPRS